MPDPSVLMKPSSGMCNMRCDYCFYCDEMQKREQESYGFMSEETLKNVIRRTMVHARRQVNYAYQGGEPALRGLDFFRKAVEFQNKYNRRGIQVHNAFQTNGSLLDEEWCRFLAENHFLVGLSVDGTKETHDACRHDKKGNGTYDVVIKAAELMDAYGVEYNILTVVTEKTAGQIEEIYKAYSRRGWNYQQYIACLDPLGEGHQKTEYAISPENYGRFLTRLFDLWYKDWQKNRQPYIRQFENYIALLMGYYPEACDQRGECGIQYVVEADGSAYPCDFYMLDEYRLGNFNENTMEEMDKRRQETGFIKRSRQLDPQCRECPYFFLCRGGCQRYRDPVEGSDYYKNYFCLAYKIFFEHCMDRIKDMAKTGMKR